jgi:hypothetical protein
MMLKHIDTCDAKLHHSASDDRLMATKLAMGGVGKMTAM